MSQILGHPRWRTMPLAFCAGRQPARKWEKAESSNLTQRDKPSRNEAETIFTLFMNMTVVRHNWRVDVRRSAVRPGVAKIDVSLSGKTVRNVLDWAVTGISATTPSRHEGEGIIPVSMIVVCRLRDNRRRTTQIRSEYPNRTLPYPHRLAPP